MHLLSTLSSTTPFIPRLDQWERIFQPTSVIILRVPPDEWPLISDRLIIWFTEMHFCVKILLQDAYEFTWWVTEIIIVLLFAGCVHGSFVLIISPQAVDRHSSSYLTLFLTLSLFSYIQILFLFPVFFLSMQLHSPVCKLSLSEPECQYFPNQKSAGGKHAYIVAVCGRRNSPKRWSKNWNFKNLH